ncbi:hypothetical protein GALMADRAFT_256991, partial [Galerina marginata CBS 339.88]
MPPSLAEFKNYHDGVRKESPRFSCLYPNATIVDLWNTTTALYTAAFDDTDQDVISNSPHAMFCERVFSGVAWFLWTVWTGSLLGSRKSTTCKFLNCLGKDKALRLLHENDIVFGDSWEPNVLHDASERRTCSSG